MLPAISAHRLKLFVRISALAYRSAWRKKKLETAKAESKPREPVHADAATRPSSCPSLAGFVQGWRTDPAMAGSEVQNACPLVQEPLTRVSSRRHQWQRGFQI
jgi:hypothetical protein